LTKLIVVEGPDGAGKSALVAKLARDLGREPFHTGGPPKNQQEKLERLARDRSFADKPMVMDRIYHISEQIYRPLDGPLDPGEADMLTREILELNPVVVYCRLISTAAMLELIDRGKKNHKPTEYMKKVIAHHRDIVHAYDRLMGELGYGYPYGLTIFGYDWMQDRYANLLESIEKCAA